MQLEKLLQSLLQYNLWANGRLLQNISVLPTAKRQLISLHPFGNIYKTVYHIYGAQYIWLERVLGRSPKSFSPENEDQDLSQLGEKLIESSEEWCIFFSNDPERYHTSIEYFNTLGESFNQTSAEIATHMVNHGSYHRGQIMSAVRSAYSDNLEPLDYIYYLRIK